jgi:hypothetical protein
VRRALDRREDLALPIAASFLAGREQLACDRLGLLLPSDAGPTELRWTSATVVSACAVVRTVATIGVYGWAFDRFLDALRQADVGLVVDVRQRRGVRGREYSWANARRLQTALAEAGVRYSHHKELAPTTELRQLQYREDDRLGVGKRSRVELAPEYRARYLHEILDRVDLDPLVAELPVDRASAVFCVEQDPEACHRSLVAARLAEEFGVTVVHLLPDVRTPTDQLPTTTRDAG